MMPTKSATFWIEHLLRRAGFGVTPEELDYYSKLGYENTLDELLHPKNVNNSRLDTLIEAQSFDFTNINDLQRWWLYRMAYSRCPLEEKMTLFWHGHFATSYKKVRSSYAMYMQNHLFRKNALGNFHELLYAVSKDPSMILWLDNQENRKGNPNENYAREIMELFSLGIGNYTETDVKEAARAFTGWRTKSGEFVFNSAQHDYANKTFLTQSGNFNGDEIVQIIVKQVAAGRFIARKLIKYFVCEEPSETMVARIASVYHSSGYDIAKIMRAIFTDPEFLSEQAYHAKIKSPAELVVGAVKTLQIRQLDSTLPVMMARMGQSLFQPPNVKGWDGGAAWVATDKMMERFNFAAKLSSQRFNEIERYYTPSQLVYKQELTSAREMVDYFLKLLVDNDVPESTRKRLVDYVSSDNGGRPLKLIPNESILDAKIKGVVHLIMSLPSYQLC